MNNYGNLGSIKSAFQTLRRMNHFVLFPVDEKEFSNPLLIEYFESPLGSPIEKKVEKVLGVAAAQAVMDNDDIPQVNKIRSAKNTARDIRDVMRFAKLEYHKKEKGLSYLEYEKRRKAIPILERISKVKMGKRIAKNMTIMNFAAYVGGPIGTSVVFVGRLVWRFIPEKVRKVVRANAKDIKEQAKSAIRKGVEKLKTTTIGKTMIKIVDKVKPYYEKAKDTVTKVSKKLSNFAKSFFAS